MKTTKRVFDVVVSAALLLILLPLLAMIAAAVVATMGRPVIFRQERSGLHGRLFVMYKFRTMKNATGPDGRPLPDRERLTPLGRLLRAASLDELPELFNVLKGEMSVVGPRPPVPAEVAEYQDWHLQRLMVTPGLTGLWQVNGRSDLSFDEMVRLDLYYAEHWSPWLDIKLMLRTVPVVLTGRGAY